MSLIFNVLLLKFHSEIMSEIFVGLFTKKCVFHQLAAA